MNGWQILPQIKMNQMLQKTKDLEIKEAAEKTSCTLKGLTNTLYSVHAWHIQATLNGLQEKGVNIWEHQLIALWILEIQDRLVQTSYKNNHFSILIHVLRLLLLTMRTAWGNACVVHRVLRKAFFVHLGQLAVGPRPSWSTNVWVGSSNKDPFSWL
jgi:hypothetical protein